VLCRRSVNDFVQISAQNKQNNNYKHQQKIFFDLHRRTSFIERCCHVMWGEDTDTNLLHHYIVAPV
jgi:hypothetical protein